MINTVKNLGVVQNIALWDRATRFVACALIMVAAVVSLNIAGAVSWETYAILFAIYPILTGILGWDPIYALRHTSTCNATGHNQCGTIPYEVDAMLGHNPIPDKGHEYEHSLTASHHKVGHSA